MSYISVIDFEWRGEFLYPQKNIGVCTTPEGNTTADLCKAAINAVVFAP